MDKLEEVSSELAAGFASLRKAALKAGPLAPEVAELVVVGALTATRQHGALRVHIRRLLGMGVAVEAIRHALVMPFGAGSTLTETIEALDILEELAGGAR
jgi:alkylhydroperoxidase/carboxymuconolactone decarboxylase family protein YurZ